MRSNQLQRFVRCAEQGRLPVQTGGAHRAALLADILHVRQVRTESLTVCNSLRFDASLDYLASTKFVKADPNYLRYILLSWATSSALAMLLDLFHLRFARLCPAKVTVVVAGGALLKRARSLPMQLLTPNRTLCVSCANMLTSSVSGKPDSPTVVRAGIHAGEMQHRDLSITASHRALYALQWL